MEKPPTQQRNGFRHAAISKVEIVAFSGASLGLMKSPYPGTTKLEVQNNHNIKT